MLESDFVLFDVVNVALDEFFFFTYYVTRFCCSSAYLHVCCLSYLHVLDGGLPC
jgi:hypothetical protein